MVDFSKIRVGDEVTIRCKVESVHSTGIVASSGSQDRWAVRKDNLATHTPSAIKIGDKVTFMGATCSWKVTALSGQRAWVTSDVDAYDHVLPVFILEHAT